MGSRNTQFAASIWHRGTLWRVSFDPLLMSQVVGLRRPKHDPSSCRVYSAHRRLLPISWLPWNRVHLVGNIYDIHYKRSCLAPAVATYLVRSRECRQHDSIVTTCCAGPSGLHRLVKTATGSVPQTHTLSGTSSTFIPRLLGTSRSRFALKRFAVCLCICGISRLAWLSILFRYLLSALACGLPGASRRASTGVEFTPSKSSGVLCATIVTTPKSLTTVSKPEGSLAPCGLQWNSLVLRRRLFPNPLPILPARGLA